MKRAGSIAGLLWRSIFVALLVSSVLTFAGLFFIGRAERVKAFDQALLDDLRTIANITQVYPDDDLYVNVEPEALTSFLAGGTRFFQVWDAQTGELLDQSPSLEALGHLFDEPQGASAVPRRVEATLPDGSAVSLLYQQAAANWGMDQKMLERTGLTIRDRQVRLLVGRARSELAQSLVPLAMACAAAALLLPAVAAAFLAALLPRALRPLRELGLAVARRDADATEPFPVSTVREVRPIALRLNELLARIGDKRQRERRFLAETAHELRNPLAELHAMADVALLRPEDAAGHAETFADMKQVVHRLAALVDHLFRLARHARTVTEMRELCIQELIEAALRELGARSQARALTWKLVGDAGLRAMSDPVLLRALIQNLMDNVIAHARAGSVAEIQWFGQNALEIIVRNECEAAAATAAPAHGAHLGAGLSIVRTYAYALGATLEAKRDGDGFEIRIVMAMPGVAATAVAVPARS
jgi:signal transduction histidine kinase